MNSRKMHALSRAELSLEQAAAAAQHAAAMLAEVLGADNAAVTELVALHALTQRIASTITGGIQEVFAGEER